MSSNEFPAAESATSDQTAIVELVAQQVGVLDSMAERPLAEHAGVYQQLHAELQAALGGIDSA
ncbi:MAG: hypothetical protein QOK11_4067 [Pseudonocardiales bacterium]|nr:hypothetical protein [Pseudonocardiales bacterium]MDT4944807.1 hypothetical protein [Pseudonocardiales bacterium]